VDKILNEICIDIEKQYQMKLIEIGSDKVHVHFLVQSALTYSATKIVKMLKSLTERQVFKRCPKVKKEAWGAEFWTDVNFASIVGKHGNENTIIKYVKKPVLKYQKLHVDRQFALF
jgi:REP element-mobilizing transposase RayT